MTVRYRRMPLREPAAVHRDERGFTVVEVMVALFILSIGLVSLAYTASIGFKYTARARIRSDAVALANQTLEQTRGLSRAILADGMLTSDLSVNEVAGNIVNCNSGTQKCYGPSNEVLVHSTSTALGSPVNPHVSSPSTTPPLPKVGQTSFTRRVYLTYLDTSKNATRSTDGEALHIIVVVSWPAGGGGPAGSITADSVVENTSGCPAEDLHPFGGPCADYVVAEAEIPAGTISITPNVGSGSSVSPPFTNAAGIAVLGSPRLKAFAGSEQAIRTSVALTTSGVQTLTGIPIVSSSSGARSDAATANSVEGIPSTLSITDTSNNEPPLLIDPPGDTNYAATFLELRKTTVDPTRSGKVSTNSSCGTPTGALGCALVESAIGSAGWGSGGWADSSAANLVIRSGTSSSLGDCRIVHTDPNDSSTPVSKIYIDRISASQLKVVIERRLPRIALGCIPSGLTPPSGYNDAWGLLQLKGITETATVMIGRTTVSSTVSNRTGTISYYNGSGYTPISMPAAGSSLAIGPIPSVKVVTSGVGSVCWTFNGGSAFTIGPDLAPAPVTTGQETVAKADLVPPLGGVTLNMTAKVGTSGSDCSGSNPPIDLNVKTALGTARIEASYIPGAA